jgi:riboflavin kinase / FMN adenylyltransferase
MNVAGSPAEIERRPRTVAIGTFDGVHVGHRAVLAAALAGPAPTVVTFHPHPRAVLGGDVSLLATLERRLELFAGLGIEDVLVVEFTDATAALTAEQFAADYLLAIGAGSVVAGSGFRFGRGRTGDLDLLRSLGLRVEEVPLVPGISSTRIRQLAAAGDVIGAARLLGRPLEVEGTVVDGDHRGTVLGFPTANVAVPEGLLVPTLGIYAGAVGEHRAAISIGVNPHFGGVERRVEAFLLDWSGDLYGRRLVVELWEWLRDEQSFASEAELVDQIGRDVARTRAAERPV